MGAIGQAERLRLTRPRQSSGARGVGDAAPYGGCVTCAAAYGAADAVPSRLPMVRGRCPRYCIRWVMDGGGYTVVNAGAVGQAERLRLTRPGNIATAGRRGRRPLRATARRRSRHIGQRMRFSRASQNGARAVPAGFHTLGGGRETDAPFAS